MFANLGVTATEELSGANFCFPDTNESKIIYDHLNKLGLSYDVRNTGDTTEAFLMMLSGQCDATALHGYAITSGHKALEDLEVIVLRDYGYFDVSHKTCK